MSKGNMGSMRTGPKSDPAKGPLKFGAMKTESSNMVKGKSSKVMGVKKGSKKMQGPA